MAVRAIEPNAEQAQDAETFLLGRTMHVSEIQIEIGGWQPPF
jgi:hypothetical protein